MRRRQQLSSPRLSPRLAGVVAVIVLAGVTVAGCGQLGNQNAQDSRPVPVPTYPAAHYDIPGPAGSQLPGVLSPTVGPLDPLHPSGYSGPPYG